MLNKYFLAFFLGLLAITCFGMITPQNTSMVLEVLLDIIKGISTFIICALFFKHRKYIDKVSLATLALPTAGFFILVLVHIYRTVILHCGGGFFDNSYWHYFLTLMMVGIYWSVIRKCKHETKIK